MHACVWLASGGDRIEVQWGGGGDSASVYVPLALEYKDRYKEVEGYSCSVTATIIFGVIIIDVTNSLCGVSVWNEAVAMFALGEGVIGTGRAKDDDKEEKVRAIGYNKLC